jgi:uncharacterized repeat protein (TIGR01451 family)
VGILIFVFVATALSPFLATPAAGFGERPYEWNQVINGTNNLDVYSGESVAQSFIATDAYRLLNVTLRLRNTGDTTDALSVTIRADAGGVPSSSSLAASLITIGNTNLGNYNIAFSSPPSLTRGARYWIVATCASSLINGYEWHHSAADVYPAGQAKINLNLGGGWVNPASPTDMYFVTYGQQLDTNLTTKILSAVSNANPGNLVTFRVYLNNTGGSSAPRAWLNDTQLPGLTYLSDTSGAAGSSTPWPSFTFADVPNGPRSFDIVTRVPIGTEPGTVLVKALTLSYLNGTSVPKTAPGSQASVGVGKQAKQVYLNQIPVGSSERLTAAKPTGGASSQKNETVKRDASAHIFDLSPVLSRDFRVYGVNATLYLDSSTHDAKNLDMNLTFSDWNGVTLTPLAYVQLRVRTNNFADYQPFTLPFPGINHTFPSGGRIRLTVRNMATSAADAILAMNSTFAASRLDLDTTTYVRIDLLDLRDASASTPVWSPKDTLVVQANVSDPFGSSEISGARINLTSPSGSVVVNYTSMAVAGTDPGSPSAWKLFRFPYSPPLAEGTYQLRVTAIESNGVLDIVDGTALVRLPHFGFVKSTTTSNVGAGDRFSYDLWFNNTGPGIAGHVWINDSLPSELTFLSSSDPGAMTGSYNWTWTSLTPGNNLLSISVQVKSGLPPIPYLRNNAYLNYTDEKGFSWPVRSAYADVAFRGPVISLSKTSAMNVLHMNEPIPYSITMQNSGDAAQTLWVNDTLPDGLAYASDTASTLGGTRLLSGNNVYFRFSNMPGLATWSFTLTAVAGPAVTRGSILLNTVTLNYTNANGGLLPPRTASWSVVVREPFVATGTVSIARTKATPADIVAATVAFANSGDEPARDAWVNVTLGPDLAFVNASVPGILTPEEVHFTLSNVGPGATVIYLNATVNVTATDHEILVVGGTLTYTDGFRNLLPSVPLSADSVEATAPLIILSVTPAQAWVEADTIAFFTIYQTNAGSGTAGDVWLTLPLPAGFVFENDTSDGTRTRLGSTYTWHWANIAPGPKSFSLQLRAQASVVNGTFTDLLFHADYTDANGNLRPSATGRVSVRFRAPQLQFAFTAAPLVARPGDTVRYTLTVSNIGNSTIRNLWLEDDLDARLEFVSSSARVQVTGENPLNWSFTDVAPNRAETVVLVLRLRDAARPRDLISNAFDVDYTNSEGRLIGSSRSDSQDVLVADAPLPFAYIGVGALAVGLLAAIFFFRRFRAEIEEVFLVYRDGVLIYHLSRSLSQDKDEDVLSGMLTAIQEFVRDAFVYGEHRELHQLDFGEYRIMIERGKRVYLAVVYAGSAASVRRRVRAVLNHVETAYSGALEDWDGDMEKVIGARDLIREHLLKSTRKPFPIPFL